jgi:hypothetical protein
MKVKTNELSGAQLDWAVAKCEGEEVRLVKDRLETLWTDNGYKPSTDWAQGGPIIEREGIALGQTADGWEATCDGEVYVYGKTPLIAAMRCCVASKLGEEVEIPTELKGE